MRRNAPLMVPLLVLSLGTRLSLSTQRFPVAPLVATVEINATRGLEPANPQLLRASVYERSGEVH